VTDTVTDPMAAYRSAVNPLRCDLIDQLEWPGGYVAAEGSYVTADSGEQYLDMIAEYGAAVLGHRHPRVMAALGDALRSGSPFIVPIGVPALAGELALRLCALAGGRLERAYFCTGGSEAVESAMKFALAATGRPEFAAFAGGYHGLTPGPLALAGHDHWRSPLPGWAPPGRHQLPFGDVAAVRQLLAARPVAAVLVEPVQGIGGARPWPDDALRALANCCAEHGTLLICDEVLTGLGRTGTWFAYQQAGIEPDIVVTSKALSGGAVPVAAVLMSRAVHESVYASPAAATIHSSTFEGHLLGMTAGLAVLDVLAEDGLLARATALGARLRAGLEALRGPRAVTGVRGRGLLLAFQVAGIDVPGDPDGAGTCMDLLMSRGVLAYQAAHDPTWLKLTPPLTLTDAQAEEFLAAVRDTLAVLAGYHDG
jgi:ornithine--oxo-acid transaminase